MLFDGLTLLAMGVYGIAVASFFVWAIKNPKFVISAGRYSPWAMITRGKPLSCVEAKEKFDKFRFKWLFIIWGRMFQMIGLGTSILGLILLAWSASRTLIP